MNNRPQREWLLQVAMKLKRRISIDQSRCSGVDTFPAVTAEDRILGLRHYFGRHSQPPSATPPERCFEAEPKFINGALQGRFWASISSFNHTLWGALGWAGAGAIKSHFIIIRFPWLCVNLHQRTCGFARMYIAKVCSIQDQTSLQIEKGEFYTELMISVVFLTVICSI